MKINFCNLKRIFSSSIILFGLGWFLTNLAMAQEELLPDLVVTSMETPLQASAQERINVSWTVTNQGEGNAQTSWRDAFYLSIDDKWDESDTILSSSYRGEPLPSGGAYTETGIVILPKVPAGTYYLLAGVDWINEWERQYSYLYESNEENNLFAQPITIQAPDLVATSINAPASASTQERIEISWTITNQGAGEVITGNWVDRFFLSKDDQFDNSDLSITAQSYANKSLVSGESYTIMQTVTIPNVPSGAYYLLIKIDNSNYIYESNEENNVLAQPITIQVPDLVVSPLQVPSQASTQEQIEVLWTVTNQGDAKAKPYWYDTIYLSKDMQWDEADIFIYVTGTWTALVPGATYTQTSTITIPNIPAGNYYLLLEVDGPYSYRQLYESNEDNNLFIQPITIQIPDLAVTAIDAPVVAGVQELISVSWTVENQGDGKTPGQRWEDSLYLSTDNILDSSDIEIADQFSKSVIAAGESYTVTTKGWLNSFWPPLSPGNYYLLLKIDSRNNLNESNEENNILIQPITLALPDLTVIALDAPDSADIQEQIPISWTVKNQGDGNLSGSGWYDALYLSTDDKFNEEADIYLSYDWHSALPANESYTKTKIITIPNVPAGVYYLLVKTNAWWPVYESDDANNVFALPITIRAPDLIVTSIQTSVAVSSQEEFTISWAVENQGDSKAATNWYDYLYLSADTTLDTSEEVSDIFLGYLSSKVLLSAGETYIQTKAFNIPNVPVGNYYILVKTDYNNSLYETKEWNNTLAKLITLVEKDEETDLSEKYSDESTLVEDLLNQKATLTDVAVTGDLTGSLNFTELEIVTINSGSFKGKGFFKGEWQAQLEGISYQGKWQGVLFPVASERKIYLKGTVSGGEAKGIVEGYLTESIPESGIYDQYNATWKLSSLGDAALSITLNLEGKLSYTDSQQYSSVGIQLLQTGFEGATLGHYTENLDTVLTHLSITSEDSPYFGEGFSIISYTSKLGSGEGWTFDKVIGQGKTELNGIFTSPLLGILTATLDEAASPQALSLSIERIDLGLPPAPELKVKVWGPERVSPGQKIDYIIEYRNDGVKAATKTIVYNDLDPLVNYLSASPGAYYDPYPHQVSWNLGALPAKSIGYLSLQAEIQWGLPQGSILENNAYILDIVLHSTEENGYANGILYNSENANQNEINQLFASLNNAQWFKLYDKTNFITGPLEVYLASKDIRTSRNGVGEDDLEIPGPLISGNRPEWFSYSGGTATAVNQAKKDRLSGNVLYLISPQLVTQEDLQAIKSKFKKIVVYQGDDLVPNGLDPRPQSKEAIISWAKKLKPPDNKIEDLIKKIEETENKTLKSLSIFRNEPGNKIIITWEDGKKTEFPITNTLESEEGIEVITFPGIKHGEWIQVLKRFKDKYVRLPTIEDIEKLKEILKKFRKEASSKSPLVITTASDPNELFVSPEGDVRPGDKLDYTISYENEGEGIAYGVYFTDTLEEDLDDSTLQIGPVINTLTSQKIGEPGIYNPNTRTITWFVGEVGSKEGGSAEFSVKVKGNTPDANEIINFATVYFPSVPETTRTNGTVNRVVTYIDNISPTTTALALPSPNDSGWNNSDITITLSSKDDEGGTGVKEIHYTLNGAESKEETTISNDIIQIPITTEGTTNLTYWSIDNMGNTEAAKSQELKIDKTPPTITTTTLPQPNSLGWNNTDVTINYSASDNLSGVASVTAPATITTEGANQQIGGETIDLADNRATTSVTVNIDKTPPQISLELKPIHPAKHKKQFEEDNSNWYNLIYSSQDSLSGLKSLEAGLVITPISGFKPKIMHSNQLEITIDEKHKELKIKATNPNEVLKDLQDGLFNLKDGEILKLKLKHKSKWEINQTHQGIEIQAPSIIFKAIASDIADNISIKELKFGKR